MPIYINEELQKEKPKKLLQQFRDDFREHLDEKNPNRIVKPITIKYIPELFVPNRDPLNASKRLIDKPRSLSISHVSQILIDDGMQDVHYTKVAPTRNAVTGSMEYKGYQSTDVKTFLRTTDIDFAFYFYAYSKDNIANNDNAKLMIENKTLENKEKATVQRNEALIQARLWNDEKDGGSSDELLHKYACTRPAIYQPENMNSDELRLAIVADFNLDRTHLTKMKFLDFTHPPKVPGREVLAKFDFVGKALEHGIISQVMQGKMFRWKESKEDIWSWADTHGQEAPATKFMLYLEKYDPDTLAKITAMVEEKEGVTA